MEAESPDKSVAATISYWQGALPPLGNSIPLLLSNGCNFLLVGGTPPPIRAGGTAPLRG